MLRILALTICTLLGIGVAAAQDYPSKPIRIIVPYPPGGGTDIAARLIGEYFNEALGQPLVVENKPGAGTAIGLDTGAKAKPDGYTLIFGSSDGLSLLPAVKASVPYKVPDDFIFIATVAKTSPNIAVTSKLPVKSLSELIAYAKANPGKVRYGTPGFASGPHLAAALFAKAAGIDMVHVPYQGTNLAIMGAVGGFVDVVVAGKAALKPFADKGTLRPLVTADTERLAEFPDVPTFQQAGLNIAVKLYYGVLAPAGTPEPIVAKLRSTMAAMMKDPKYVARMGQASGYEPVYLDGPAFRDYVVKDLEQWKDVAKSANIAVTD